MKVEMKPKLILDGTEKSLIMNLKEVYDILENGAFDCSGSSVICSECPFGNSGPICLVDELMHNIDLFTEKVERNS